MKESGQGLLLNSFLLVTGALLGAFVAILFIVVGTIADGSGHMSADDPDVQMAIDERIAPVGSVLLLGSDELDAAATVAIAVPAPNAAPLTGPQVYNQACFACHSTPGIGAPILGNQADWRARVAQGMETLIDHAINGYTGEAGAMPAKGGQPNLSDDEIIAAIEYMLEELE